MSCLASVAPGNSSVTLLTILVSIARVNEGLDREEAELGVPHTFVVKVPKVTNLFDIAIAIDIDLIKEANTIVKITVTISVDARSEECLGEVCGFPLGDFDHADWAEILVCVKVSDAKLRIKTSLATHTSYKKRIVLMIDDVNEYKW